ncbi:MAG TPA: hypothetical protein ENN73_07185 [Firmicutes bacterium]|nr:hypothetical protein [Bacillota bacterium]
MVYFFNQDEDKERLPDDDPELEQESEDPADDLDQGKVQKIKRKGGWRKGGDRRLSKDRRESEEPVVFDRRETPRRKDKRRKKDRGESPFQK